MYGKQNVQKTDMNEKSKIAPSYSKDRHQLGEVLPLKTPYTVIADISDRCNFRCNYCFRSMSPEKTQYYGNNKLMEWSTYQRIIDQILEFQEPIKRLSLSHNGESLIHPQFVQMVEYATEKSLGEITEIHTNAAMLTEELVHRIIDTKLGRMVISLQGLSAEKYYETCGVRIDYNKFYDNLKSLYALKKNMKICIKVVKEALGEGEEGKFYDMFLPISDSAYIEQVVPLWPDMDEMEREVTKNKYGDDFKKQDCCPLMFYTINVLPDGTVFPCTNLNPPYLLGNVNTTTLKQCWESKEREKFLLKQLKYTRESNIVCKNCYIPQNTVMTPEDSIDAYREEIIARIKETV